MSSRGRETQDPVAQCHWFSASARAGGHLPGIQTGPRVPLEPLSVTRARCGRNKRMGSRRNQAGGLLVSWGHRLQESSRQEKETKNNPERESPERGTGKWEGEEGQAEEGNCDASLSPGPRNTVLTPHTSLSSPHSSTAHFSTLPSPTCPALDNTHSDSHKCLHSDYTCKLSCPGCLSLILSPLPPLPPQLLVFSLLCSLA